jgi:hypothetical protein
MKTQVVSEKECGLKDKRVILKTDASILIG